MSVRWMPAIDERAAPVECGERDRDEVADRGEQDRRVERLRRLVVGLADRGRAE